MRARAALASLASLAALASAAAAPATARADIAFTPCTPAGFACGSLAVPLARGAAAPGTVTLRVTRRLAGPAPVERVGGRRPRRRAWAGGRAARGRLRRAARPRAADA